MLLGFLSQGHTAHSDLGYKIIAERWIYFLSPLPSVITEITTDDLSDTNVTHLVLHN